MCLSSQIQFFLPTKHTLMRKPFFLVRKYSQSWKGTWWWATSHDGVCCPMPIVTCRVRAEMHRRLRRSNAWEGWLLTRLLPASASTCRFWSSTPKVSSYSVCSWYAYAMHYARMQLIQSTVHVHKFCVAVFSCKMMRKVFAKSTVELSVCMW
jgi:hypothetical protein